MMLNENSQLINDMLRFLQKLKQINSISENRLTVEGTRKTWISARILEIDNMNNLPMNKVKRIERSVI